MNQGQGTQAPTDGAFLTIYSNFYTGIARTNALLENMVRAKDVVPETKYNQIEAQALFIRAFHYMYLTELWLARGVGEHAVPLRYGAEPRGRTLVIAVGSLPVRRAGHAGLRGRWGAERHRSLRWSWCRTGRGRPSGR